ncbi:MAG TPA: cytochrome c biogenesis protein CcsA, partial [Gaiellaceae bacterium]|nr:cytochrome c biogenesis protein CcsA [Gaiellaceae bacterium]
MAEALFWPAILGYGEAAIAYSSARYTRLATWGVRLGWIAQTALLGVQAARVDGFPWSTWAGSLNLFVWLVVGTYLIWGCQVRFRLVGLTVMPLAALLFVVSRVGGGTAAGERSNYGNLFLTVHVGFTLAAFAGFTLAAALAALYLVEERRLQRHAADILRLKLPSLVVLERLTIRTIAVALPLLTVGL